MIYAYRIVLILVLSLCVVTESYGTQNDDIEGDAKQLIALFYSDLLSNKSPIDCAQIFYDINLAEGNNNSQESLSAKKDNNRKIWEYIRAYKNILLFQTVNDPQILIEGIGLAYLYMGADRKDIRGKNLSIMLFARVSKDARIGIRKEIIFPLIRVESERGQNLLINYSAIRINGIFLNYFDTDGDVSNFVEKLGFENRKTGGSLKFP